MDVPTFGQNYIVATLSYTFNLVSSLKITRYQMIRRIRATEKKKRRNACLDETDLLSLIDFSVSRGDLVDMAKNENALLDSLA